MQSDKVNRGFGRTCCRLLYLLPISYWLFAWLIFRPWKWRRHVEPKWWLTFSALHVVIPEDRTLHGHRCQYFKSIRLKEFGDHFWRLPVTWMVLNRQDAIFRNRKMAKTMVRGFNVCRCSAHNAGHYWHVNWVVTFYCETYEDSWIEITKFRRIQSKLTFTLLSSKQETFIGNWEKRT